MKLKFVALSTLYWVLGTGYELSTEYTNPLTTNR
jgi:hypothetical protein